MRNFLRSLNVEDLMCARVARHYKPSVTARVMIPILVVRARWVVPDIDVLKHAVGACIQAVRSRLRCVAEVNEFFDAACSAVWTIYSHVSAGWVRHPDRFHRSGGLLKIDLVDTPQRADVARLAQLGVRSSTRKLVSP